MFCVIIKLIIKYQSKFGKYRNNSAVKFCLSNCLKGFSKTVVKI